ncbi:MAG: response regulator [Actinomycetes bacterium]
MTRKIILVVDDNEDIRGLLVLVLQKEGYEVHTAVDGEDALEKAYALKPDLILLDVMMPKLSGLDVLSIIRGHVEPQINQVPVMMITAKSAMADIDQAGIWGATSYIVKPFRPLDLRLKVLAILGVH